MGTFFFFTYFKPTKPEDKTELLKGLRKQLPLFESNEV